MFDFQKHRRNPNRIDEIPNSAALGRIFRLGEIPPEPPMVVMVPSHSVELEAQIAARIQRKLDVIMIADSGSSMGVSLHDTLASVADLLPSPKIKPLDISEIIGRNRSQR